MHQCVESPLDSEAIAESIFVADEAILPMCTAVRNVAGGLSLRCHDSYGPLSRDNQSRLCNTTTAEMFQFHTAT